MANKKLSQITAAGAPPAVTDQIVGVTGGAIDNLFSISQIAAVVGGGTAATDYYVNGATGSDSNNGSIGAPWKTLQHAADILATVRATVSVNSIYNTTTVHIADGTYAGFTISALPGFIDTNVLFQGHVGNSALVVIADNPDVLSTGMVGIPPGSQLLNGLTFDSMTFKPANANNDVFFYPNYAAVSATNCIFDATVAGIRSVFDLGIGGSGATGGASTFKGTFNEINNPGNFGSLQIAGALTFTTCTFTTQLLNLANYCVCKWQASSVTGSPTGKAYTVQTYSNLQVLNSSFTHATLPGSTAGTADSTSAIEDIQSAVLVNINATGGPVYNVKNFGALGNGTTDDTTAINSAIAAFNTAGTGVLYFPAGNYLASAGLTAITAKGIIQGDGASANTQATAQAGATTITCSSATAVLFTINTTTSLLFKELSLRCSATASAGAGISVSSAQSAARISYERLSVARFYIGIDVQVGASWVMDQCWIEDCVLYHVKIRNTVNPDAGDWFITNTYFNISSAGYNNAIGLRCESSGGGKVANCKWNGTPSTTGFDKAIDVEGAGNTVDFIITNCSIEGWTNNAILSNGSWPNIVISNIQTIGSSVGGSICVKVVNNTSIAITNCVLTGAATTAVDIATGVSGVTVAGIMTNLATVVHTNVGNFQAYTDSLPNVWANVGQLITVGSASGYLFDDRTNGPNSGHVWQLYANNSLGLIWAQDASSAHDVFAMTHNSVIQARSGGAYTFASSSTDPTASPDTGVSRSAAGVIALGNGSAGDGSASMLAKTKAGAPANTDIPSGCWTLIRDTTNSTTKLYYNNAGTLMSVALT